MFFLVDIPGPALLSSMTRDGGARVPSPASTSQPSQASAAFSSFVSPPSASQSATPQPNYASSAFAAPATPAADPFASLISPVSTGTAAGGLIPTATSATNDDDEWSFSSALPPETPRQPQEHRIVVNNSSIKIEMLANRAAATPNAMSLAFAFSNNTAQPVSEIHFQTAVTKACFRPAPTFEYEANIRHLGI